MCIACTLVRGKLAPSSSCWWHQRASGTASRLENGWTDGGVCLHRMLASANGIRTKKSCMFFCVCTSHTDMIKCGCGDGDVLLHLALVLLHAQ